MLRKKRFLFIALLGLVLLSALLLAFRLELEPKPRPLVVAVRSVNGESFVVFGFPVLPRPKAITMPWAGRIQRSTAMGMKALLFKYEEGTWRSENLRAGPKAVPGKLEYSFPMPTNGIWKVQVVSSEVPIWRLGSWGSFRSPFRVRRQSYESEAFTNSPKNGSGAGMME